MASNGNNGDDTIKDSSPFPSGPEMDLDMWKAGRRNPAGYRSLNLMEQEPMCHLCLARVYADDTTTRRIEMVGDLYEGLRRAAEKMSEAGMDVAEEHAILAEFITPKPFPEGA